MDFKIYLDNIIYGIQKYGGVSTYWKELQKYFIGLDNVHIITQSEDPNILDLAGNAYQKNKFIFENFFPASILRFLPFTNRLPAGSLYHSSYYRTCLQKNIVNIYTVHDFTYKKGYSSKFLRRLGHIILTNFGLRNADGIICISENTKRDLKHYFPQIPENKIRVIYHGVSKDFFPIEKPENNDITEGLNLNSPFVVFIGKRRLYKNFDSVPKAVKQVSDLKLVVVGGGDLSSSEVRDLENTIPGRYIKIGNISSGDLNTLYNKAFVLIYPSISEGFGFPVVEAMRAGCPVITTDLSSIPEVGGDAALMISEVSSEAIVEKINLLRDADMRASVIEKGFHQSSKFGWERCFSETLKFYEDIYRQKFNT